LHSSSTYTKQIKDEALRLGFDDCGISRSEPLEEDFKIFQDWLRSKSHANMDYLERNTDKRRDPRNLVEGSKSVISVILNYYPANTQKDPEAPVLSKYAYGRDYHEVMMKKLNCLLDFIHNSIPGSNGRVFVDSAPVLEHALARQSGLGWIGRNSLLISKKYGSFVFIGEVIVNIDLDYDYPVKDLCGTCQKCIISCPTGAIMEGRVVDAGKCISFHTIENKNDSIPAGLKANFQQRVFGCDICQDVCPWNKKVKAHHVEEFLPHPDVLSMTKVEWFSLDRDRFNELFKNSALKRLKYEGLCRNLEFLK
jgi:epoxyqueuosine reductase